MARTAHPGAPDETPGRQTRLGGWLEGGPTAGSHPGARLGLPATGSGSLARLGRRAVALCIDWGLSLAISAAFFALDPWATLSIFALENLLLVSTLGHTIGHRIMGIQVRRLAFAGTPPGVETGAPPPGLLRALLRTVLICLVIPAVVWDADGRGMHDRAAGTVIVRR